MSQRRVRVWISGRVQGVFFRAHVQDEARQLGLSGWVRNLRDGRVEAVFEGPAEKVEKMLAWCRKGSPLSYVERVETQEEELQGTSNGFEIRR